VPSPRRGEGALSARLREAAQRLGLGGQGVLVAVSGGVDSTVLLHGLAALAGELDLRLAVGHVNHGLRGAESDGDEALVADCAKRLALPFAARRVAPLALRGARPHRARPTLQEAARALRRAALAELADERGCAWIATAHTLDDQAETVLMRLLRGASPAGLSGIPERAADGRTVRPLLGTSRAEIERYARERGLVWREDASNRDVRYGRGRLRQLGLARIAEAFNPAWLRAIANLAEAQREESAWIDETVAREAARCLRISAEVVVVDRTAFRGLPEALARRVARSALRALGGGRDLSRLHLLRSLAFVRDAEPGSALDLPSGLRLRAGRSECLLSRSGSASSLRC
jgi:tRNA(Ile)-lysidine synthase